MSAERETRVVIIVINATKSVEEFVFIFSLFFSNICVVVHVSLCVCVKEEEIQNANTKCLFGLPLELTQTIDI